MSLMPIRAQRAAFDAYGASDRTVWLAELECPNLPRKPTKSIMILAIAFIWPCHWIRDQGKDNFRQFDLLGENVKFIKGIAANFGSKPIERSLSMSSASLATVQSVRGVMDGLESRAAGQPALTQQGQPAGSLGERRGWYASDRKLLPAGQTMISPR
jgi:hypothetical protein